MRLAELTSEASVGVNDNITRDEDWRRISHLMLPYVFDVDIGWGRAYPTFNDYGTLYPSIMSSGIRRRYCGREFQNGNAIVHLDTDSEMVAPINTDFDGDPTPAPKPPRAHKQKPAPLPVLMHPPGPRKLTAADLMGSSTSAQEPSRRQKMRDKRYKRQ
jgi:hypothetical protein